MADDAAGSDIRRPVGADPVVSSADGLDPKQEALLADSVGLEMLVVLEQLTPAERLAFVLHDTSGLPVGLVFAGERPFAVLGSRSGVGGLPSSARGSRECT